MEQAAVKRKKIIVPFLIGLLILSSIVFIKHLTNRMNSYIEKNGKISMGAVVEQMQQTYELQTNGYYSRLHLVEDYLLQEKELSLETEVTSNFFEVWEKESESTLLFLQENGKAITADGTKIRMDIPSKLLLDLILQNWLPGIMKKYKTVLIWLQFHVSHIAWMEKRIPQLERYIIMQN